MYAQLTLAVSRTDAPLMIRPSSMVADASGTRVAVVEHGAIHWRPVRIDSDLGDQVSVLSGLQGTDEIVVAPSDRLTEGLLVTAEVAKPPAAGKPGKPEGEPDGKPAGKADAAGKPAQGAP
jgi:hypothetical protein